MTMEMYVRARPGDEVPPRQDCPQVVAHGPHWRSGPLLVKWRCHGLSAVDPKEILRGAAAKIRPTDPQLADALTDMADDYAGPWRIHD